MRQTKRTAAQTFEIVKSGPQGFLWKNTRRLGGADAQRFRGSLAARPIPRASAAAQFRLPAALPPRPAATHLLAVLAGGDAQAPEPLLQLANVHHAVAVAVQLLEEGLEARRRRRVLAGRRGQDEAPQPAQHGPGSAGRRSAGGVTGERTSAPPPPG